MRLMLCIGIVAATTLQTQAQTLVPDSTAPDGKAALYYHHIPSVEPGEGYSFYFEEPNSRSPLSNDLVPVPTHDLTTQVAMDTFDSRILFGKIGDDVEALKNKGISDAAFTFEVTWSSDSRWAVIEGGTHKFWRAEIYHWIDGRFQRIEHFDDQFFSYFNAHRDGLPSPDRGAIAAIQKISPRNYDSPDVCWLENGLAAINAYPYLLKNPDYQRLERQNLFFVVDLQTNPPKIIGFCR